MYTIRKKISRILSIILLKWHRVTTGKNFRVNGVLKLANSGTIRLGDHVTINSGAYFNPVYGARRTVLNANSGASILIGNHVGISNSLIFAAEGITIEDHVMIGGGCSICDTDFHPLDYQLRIAHNAEAIAHKPILIKEGAFVGMNSIILKGVTIGKHSIVGAGSVVTKDIPDGEIWAGNPARFIREL